MWVCGRREEEGSLAQFCRKHFEESHAPLLFSHVLGWLARWPSLLLHRLGLGLSCRRRSLAGFGCDSTRAVSTRAAALSALLSEFCIPVGLDTSGLLPCRLFLLRDALFSFFEGALRSFRPDRKRPLFLRRVVLAPRAWWSSTFPQAAFSATAMSAACCSCSQRCWARSAARSASARNATRNAERSLESAP